MMFAKESLPLAEALAHWAGNQGYRRDSSALVAALPDIASEISVGIPATVHQIIDPLSTQEVVLQSLADLKMRLDHIREHADEASAAVEELASFLESRRAE
ncbi:MAG: hypothetical protein KBF21_08010 [Thermoanaerobaculia bacterium]|nr:hypothetical protein [Thermoanaerobaculia bacterium]